MPSRSISGMRVEPALPSLAVLQRVIAHDAVAGANRADRPEALLAAKRLAVDAQALLAVLIDEASRRPVTERRIDVVLPQIERLENVTVCVNHIVCQTHHPTPLGPRLLSSLNSAQVA